MLRAGIVGICAFQGQGMGRGYSYQSLRNNLPVDHPAVSVARLRRLDADRLYFLPRRSICTFIAGRLTGSAAGILGISHDLRWGISTGHSYPFVIGSRGGGVNSVMELCLDELDCPLNTVRWIDILGYCLIVAVGYGHHGFVVHLKIEPVGAQRP